MDSSFFYGGWLGTEALLLLGLFLQRLCFVVLAIKRGTIRPWATTGNIYGWASLCTLGVSHHVPVFCGDGDRRRFCAIPIPVYTTAVYSFFFHSHCEPVPSLRYMHYNLHPILISFRHWAKVTTTWALLQLSSATLALEAPIASRVVAGCVRFTTLCWVRKHVPW